MTWRYWLISGFFPVLVCWDHKIVLHCYENQNKNNFVIMLRKSWEIVRNQLTISYQIGANISKLWFCMIDITLRFLLYVLVLLYVLFNFFADWINYKYWTISKKIHHTVFFTTILLFLLYVLVGKFPSIYKYTYWLI